MPNVIALSLLWQLAFIGRSQGRRCAISCCIATNDAKGLFRSTPCRSLRPANGCFCAAGGAPAAAVPDEVVEIFAAVVVGYLLPRCDGAQRHEHDPTVARYRLCIRPAGMIHVARHVPSWGTVDRPSAVEFEHIFGASSLASLGFLGRNARAAIGRDVGGSLDQLRCEQAEPRRRATDAEGP